MGKINPWTQGSGYQRRSGLVYPLSSYWDRQESPRLLEQRLRDEQGATVFPSGRIKNDDADRWLKAHDR